MTTVSIGIVGDFDPDRATHRATVEALRHAAGHLSMDVRTHWVSTLELDGPQGDRQLHACDGFWGAPGSPYASESGALRAIRHCREHEAPFLGT